jgi:hypothetical protein
MPRNLRHYKANHGSSRRSDPYRFYWPRSELQQALIAQFRHSGDFRRFLWVKGLLIELDGCIGPVPNFVNSTLATPAQFRPKMQLTPG